MLPIEGEMVVNAEGEVVKAEAVARAAAATKRNFIMSSLIGSVK